MLVTIRRLTWPLAAPDRPDFISPIAKTLHRWVERRRQREELARMTDHALRDLGLAPADRRWIARSAFWKCYPFADGAKDPHRR